MKISNMENTRVMELIAKALRLEGFPQEDWVGPYFCVPENSEIPRSQAIIYRWLDDDRDAFRLAVELRLSIDRSQLCRTTVYNHMLGINVTIFNTDEYIATRHAIAEAAVGIGLRMEKEEANAEKRKKGICCVPPEGWHCTREAGHEGPCAAHPIGDL